MKRFNSSLLLLAILSMGIFSCSNAKKSEENTGEAVEEKLPKLVGKEFTYEVDSVTLTGYMAFDENAEEKRPGILVVHEWWGHNDYVRRRADMLAELGYVALAIDMYGDGKLAEHPGDAQKFMMEVMSSMDIAKARFEKGLNELKNSEKVDNEKIGAIGYCMGGSIILNMANAGYELDGVAAFHASVGLGIWPEKGGVKGKILVCNGAADTFVSDAQVATFKNKMDSAEVDYKYIAYEGAVHAFTAKEADANREKFGVDNFGYHPEADSASWEEMKSLFVDVF